MENFVGREAEKALLEDIFNSGEAELVAVYGRRRVGKTFLIRSIYKEHIVFEFTGMHEAGLFEQLENFSRALQAAMKSAIPPEAPANWSKAFRFLQDFLTPHLSQKRAVIFFDEFPWIHTPKSRFLQAFEHFWNTWASRQPGLIAVICGSAASWMIRNVVNNKGGLHNRITHKIRLLPFTLYETELFLRSRKINLDRYQQLQLYMAMGGIPQYLKNVRAGESAAQNIDRMCFSKDGILKEEFGNLYRSLFDNSDTHIAIIKALAVKKQGLSRKEIIAACGLTSGGTTTKLLDELLESGFIHVYIPFDKNSKEGIYNLADEYSLFYLRFIENKRASGKGTWTKLSSGSSWESWSGMAFERICLKHVAQIKQALGISGVLSEESVWRYKAGKNSNGAQIDLLIDRRDHCINVCEIKYSLGEFAITKGYANALKNKIDVFRQQTKSRKSLFLTMITTYGVKRNIYYAGLVQNEIMMDQLFAPLPK
ncbi:MAG: ATP-binding protein [Chitinophagaceae bacterium]|nr:MAG: ATP-binding protein [Chitinophagaceae bacterium]